MRSTVIRAMKLITHNMLTSHVKGVKNGYPLKIEAESTRTLEVEFNPDFVARMIPRIEWAVLYDAVSSLNMTGSLPAQPVENYESDEEFLKEAHRAMLEIEIVEGNLVCPESGRKFPIKNGIPNMLLNEDEV
ncbi:multifunctional methyltransferase subunit TRM112-like protein [Diadema setosum]|uniref:multifunctional methyltransferase subunit TRM112-like protein n=1 Tax=Diadema antillarum TaxID=105358 RepID=UPI003A8C1D40